MSESQPPPAPAAPAVPRTAPIPPLAGFGPAFAWGARLAFRPKRFLLIAAGACAAGYFFGWASVAQRVGINESERWYRLWKLLDQGVLTYLMPLVALLFVATGFSREISQRTLVFHLVRPISRSTLFLARYFSGVLPAFVVGTLLLWSLLHATGLDVPGKMYGVLALVALFEALLLGAVFYLLSSIFRWGTITGLIYVFAIESLLGQARGTMQSLSMTYHVRSLFRDQLNPFFMDQSWQVSRSVDPDVASEILSRARNMESATSAAAEALTATADPVYASSASAIIAAVGFTLLFLAIGVWRTKRRDFPLKD